MITDSGTMAILKRGAIGFFRTVLGSWCVFVIFVLVLLLWLVGVVSFWLVECFFCLLSYVCFFCF